MLGTPVHQSLDRPTAQTDSRFLLPPITITPEERIKKLYNKWFQKYGSWKSRSYSGPKNYKYTVDEIADKICGYILKEGLEHKRESFDDAEDLIRKSKSKEERDFYNDVLNKIYKIYDGASEWVVLPTSSEDVESFKKGYKSLVRAIKDDFGLSFDPLKDAFFDLILNLLYIDNFDVHITRDNIKKAGRVKKALPNDFKEAFEDLIEEFSKIEDLDKFGKLYKDKDKIPDTKSPESPESSESPEPSATSDPLKIFKKQLKDFSDIIYDIIYDKNTKKTIKDFLKDSIGTASTIVKRVKKIFGIDINKETDNFGDILFAILYKYKFDVDDAAAEMLDNEFNKIVGGVYDVYYKPALQKLSEYDQDLKKLFGEKVAEPEREKQEGETRAKEEVDRKFKEREEAEAEKYSEDLKKFGGNTMAVMVNNLIDSKSAETDDFYESLVLAGRIAHDYEWMSTKDGKPVFKNEKSKKEAVNLFLRDIEFRNNVFRYLEEETIKKYFGGEKTRAAVSGSKSIASDQNIEKLLIDMMKNITGKQNQQEFMHNLFKALKNGAILAGKPHQDAPIKDYLNKFFKL